MSKRESESVEIGVIKKQDSSVSKGIAQLKPQYIVANNIVNEPQEYEEPSSERMLGSEGNAKKKNKKRGQNKNRDNRQVKEIHPLCPKLIHGEPAENCQFGDNCRFNHDLDSYLKNKKPEIINDNFQVCPVFVKLGYCPMGFKCRFLSSHLDKESKTLVTKEVDTTTMPIYDIDQEINHISNSEKTDLIKRRFEFPKSEEVLFILDAIQQEYRDLTRPKKGIEEAKEEEKDDGKDKAPQVIQRELEAKAKREKQKETYLKYKDTRYFASEKKPLDFKRKKILSPLTTVGNLPYRRLMKKLGCDVTYSEMALGVPLIQGTNSEWALPKAHISEKGGFGVQIACSKDWQASKAAEALAHSLGAQGGISEINLNSGCPIDLLYRQGSGSGLLDNPAKMIRCLNAMNYSSGDIPVTVKIRTGTKDSHPIAEPLMKRLVYETDVAAVTLHGRSRQQRYTKLADWNYVSEVAKSLRRHESEFKESEQGKESRESQNGHIQFIGNGDINNFEDWYRILDNDKNIDSIMVARGALIKPWIFEEIDQQQYIDKTSTERLDILKDYSQFAMEHWGTDEYGISQCRRFFCEFMSFYHRYIPMGICERYPVKLNERPPNWIGRDETETLLGSTDVNDWIKLSELFFGPVEENFTFMPKHKSNSYVKPSN